MLSRSDSKGGIALEDLAVDTASGRLVVTTAIAPADWDAFVDRHPHGTIYHRTEWHRIFTGVFGHDTLYLAVRRDGTLCGVLPLVRIPRMFTAASLVSLPFVNYGGLLADDDDARAALLDRVESFAVAEGLRYVELRHDRRHTSLPARTHKVSMRRALEPTGDAAWAALDRKIRNQVRKAQQCGYSVHPGGESELDGFYEVFARNMRDLGTPVYPKAFFREMLRMLGARAAVTVVRRGDEPAAAAFTVRYRDTVEVPWASSLRRFRRESPNTLLYWSLIEQAVEANARTFDFGRSTPGGGTYAFKAQWGAEARQLHWEYVLPAGAALPDLSPANPRFAPAIAMWKRLPVPLANLLGPTLVRRLP